MVGLFDPINIGTLALKNRLVMTAMDLGYSNDGLVNDRFIDFYTERADGGTGLIVVGGCYPEQNGKAWKSILGLDDDRYIPSLARFTEAMHRHGAKTAAQILHGGRYASSLFSKMQPVSASSIPSRLARDTSRALSASEIKQVIQGYATATRRVKEAGFDTVEIHGGMGYLINQFLSPISNQRSDEYGGGLDNRMRFAVETIEAIRKTVGDDFPIIFRLSGDELMEGGLKVRDNIEIAKRLAKVGVDAFHVSPGWHESKVPIMIMVIPRTAYAVLAASIRENVDIPVISGIRINDLAQAEELLRDGQTDLVSIGRPLIADPELPKKYKEGRLEDIRTCIACKQGCFDELLNMRSVTCLYNPRAGREREYNVTPTAKKKKVMVVGGGPGGMEAASVAAQRGHDVTLYEKTGMLGGQLYYAYKPPGREEFANVITYLERQVKKEGVKVVLGVEVTPETVKTEQPDTLIVSTGSTPSIPPIPGINSDNVALAMDVLDGKSPVGREVVIIGGGTVGTETALYIANLGSMRPDVAMFLLKNEVIDLPTALEKVSRGHRNITILEMKRRVGGGFGISTRWVMEREIEGAGIKSITKIMVKEIRQGPEGGVVYEKDGKETCIPADTVIIATGYIPNDTLSKHLNGLVPEVYTIGDCVKVRTALEAVHEGFKLGLTV